MVHGGNCTCEYIDNYPNGFIIFLKPVSVGFVSPGNKSTQIVKIKENEREGERNKCMVCSMLIILIFYLG